MTKNLALSLFLAAAIPTVSLTASADGIEGITRITGADCNVMSKSSGEFNSIVSRVSGNTAKVWVYNGPRNAVNPLVGLVASGEVPAYSMVGFPHATSETVVIKLNQDLQKVVKLPNLVLSSKIKNPSTDMPYNGYISNPMTEDDDVSMRCYMSYTSTQENLFVNNPAYIQKAEHPSLCAIEFRDGGRTPNWTHGCTATVIGDNKLLTAAHCQESFWRTETRVRCGQDPTWRKIQRWVANPDYRPKQYPISNPHDISVITLDSNTGAPALAVEADVKATETMIFENKNCVHYGMGARIDGSMGALHKSRYHQPDALLGGYHYVAKIFEMTHMIASDPLRFMRSGDSGGPLICQNDRGQDTIVGVHSFISTASSSAKSAMTSRSYQFIQSELSQ